MTANSVELVESMVVANLAAISYVKYNGGKMFYNMQITGSSENNRRFLSNSIQDVDYVILPAALGEFTKSDK